MPEHMPNLLKQKTPVFSTGVFFILRTVSYCTLMIRLVTTSSSIIKRTR